MKKFKHIGFITLGLILMSQFNPQSKRITEQFFPEKNEVNLVTPALKKTKGFTNYEELIIFLQEMQTSHSDFATLAYIGKSKKGCQIPIFKITAPQGNNKIKVWLQGGLHGDEPGSTESMLYLIHQLLNTPDLKKMLTQLEIAIVPMANIDGYLKQKRNNAENLDLNRDQTKLMAHESITLKKAFHQFKPHVALDFHEYRPYRRDFIKMGPFGVTAYYDVMFLNTGNLNVPKPLRDYIKTHFEPHTLKNLDQHQLSYHDYTTTINHEGNIHFNLGGTSPRSSVTNYSLQNCLATLVEVRGVGIGRTSFKRRIFTAYQVALSYLEVAVQNKEAIFQLLAQNNEDTELVTVKSNRKVYPNKMTFIDIENVTKLELDVTFRDALQSKPTLQRSRPLGYFFDAQYHHLAEKIAAFGLKVIKVDASQEFNIETYHITEQKTDPVKYEKMTLQDIKVELKTLQKRFPEGTYYVSMDQIQSNILPELFEPEANSSFVSFGVIPTKNLTTLPFYRHIK